jgi:O-antigen/teichoic acid export membrane protein/CelD/BcsL family acetyltransferase involved in cellulose biosynthesis
MTAAAPAPDWRARLRSWTRDGGQRARTQRLAGGTFILRVVNAVLAFALQVLLARWLGTGDYGVYVYVWVWLLVLGGVAGLGLPSAAQRFVPEYAGRGDTAGLRGFVYRGRLLALACAAGVALLGAAALALAGDAIDPAYHLPLYLALAGVPAMVLTDMQDGIARSFDWLALGLLPTFLIRPLLILLLILTLYVIGAPATALWAMGATLAALWLTGLGDLFALNRRLPGKVPAGPSRAEPRRWLAVALPIVAVDAFYVLLTFTDVLLLQVFEPSSEVGVYFAATKIMAIVTFVYFGIGAATAHRFAHFAAMGDRAGLQAIARTASRWTFWPSLALAALFIALGAPLLSVFGPDFTIGTALLPVLAVGVLARAAIGPAERLLPMAGAQMPTALVYVGTFVFNLVLNIVLVPRLGVLGAAAATSVAFVGETICLYIVARRRLGLHILFVGGHSPAPAAAMPKGVSTETLDAAGAAAHRAAWQALAARAAESNPFYAPAVMLAALRHLDLKGARVVLAWADDAGAPRRLIGAWLLGRRRWRYLVPLPLWSAVPAYAPLATPLLDRGDAERAAAALLAHAASTGAKALFVPTMTAGPAAAALARAAARAGYSSRRFAVHRRAMLTAGSAAALDQRIPRKTRKELARLARRLGEDADLDFEVATAEADLAPALDAFLDLERSGWKGRRGTAMAARPQEEAFIRAAAAGLAAHGHMRVALLRHGGRPIAGALVILGVGRAFYFKTAYDERYRRFSPGALVTRALSGHLLADPAILATDSLATANHPMIDRLWPDRLELFDWMAALQPGTAPAFALMARLEVARGRLYHRLRRLRDRLLRRT